MIRSEPRRIKYVINEEKRTIVAYMEDCSFDAIDAIHKNGICMADTRKEYPWSEYNLDGKYLIKGCYRGKAVCSAEDVWNVDEGKRIARNKMLQKYYNAKEKKLSQAIMDMQERLLGLNEYDMYMIEKLKKAEDCLL